MQPQPYASNYDYQGAYNNSVNSYNQAAQNTMQQQNNLQGFQQNMQDPSKMYANDLGSAQQMYGFNPQDLLRAQQNLANTQTTVANLPQATQQQGNYYGTTAGAQANNYAQQAGNLQGVLAGQTNAVNAYQGVLGATQQQAQQQAGLGFQGQQLQAQILQNLLSNALGYQGQQQSQEGVAQGEQSGYGSYLNASKQAQASMISAQAQAAQANATAQQIQQQITLAQQVADQQRNAQQKASASGVSAATTPGHTYSANTGIQGGMSGLSQLFGGLQNVGGKLLNVGF
jgi:hypothetical protein